MMGDSPALLPVEPAPDELVAISVWTSPSLEMLECGKMKSHVPAMPGYCELARGEMEMESVSQRLAISLTSVRLKVMDVSPRKAGMTAESRTATQNARENQDVIGGAERPPPWRALQFSQYGESEKRGKLL